MPVRGIFGNLTQVSLRSLEPKWLPSPGLGSRLSNGPYEASYGLLWGLVGHTSGLTKSTDHPSRTPYV